MKLVCLCLSCSTAVKPRDTEGGLYSHHGCSCGSSLRSHSCLVGLVLGGLNLGLQVGGGVEVLALLARAATLDVVHAHGDRVVAGVDHGAVARVGETAVCLAASAVAPLELAANLEAGQSHAHKDTHAHRQTRMDTCTQRKQTHVEDKTVNALAFGTCQETKQGCSHCFS